MERLKKWWYKGDVSITHPQNNAIISPGATKVEGRHKNAKGIYWLLTVRGEDYWIQSQVNLLPDGTWRETINIGDHPGPRTSVLILARVNKLVDSFLRDIRDRSNKAKYWGAVKMNPAERDLSIMQGIVLQIR